MSVQLAKVIREEIARLSKKEIRSSVSTLKGLVAKLRKDNAKLRRELVFIQRRIKAIEVQSQKGLKTSVVESELPNTIRFSPSRVKSQRKKLGFSAADYGRLLGVHQLTIYKWEKGETKPQKSQLAKLLEIRGIGKKEALRRLSELGEGSLPKRRGRPPKHESKRKERSKSNSKRRGRPPKSQSKRRGRPRKVAS